MKRPNGMNLTEQQRSILTMLIGGASLVRVEIAHGQGRTHKGRWAADRRNDAIRVLTQEDL
jgi:hypothetical protein